MKFEWERCLNLDLFSWALRSSWSHGGTKYDAHTSFVDEWDTDEYCWIPSNVLSVSEERWFFCPQPLGGLEHLWLHFSMHCVNVSEHVHSFTCVFRCVNGFSNNRHVRFTEQRLFFSCVKWSKKASSNRWCLCVSYMVLSVKTGSRGINSTLRLHTSSY